MRGLFIKKIVILGVILAVFILNGADHFLGVPLHSQTKESTKVQEHQQEEQLKEIPAGPRDIKERTAVLVFLGWLWLSIFVLIYFLRQKIKEVDQLQAMKFFETVKKPPSDDRQ